jgi:hypothetical protein
MPVFFCGSSVNAWLKYILHVLILRIRSGGKIKMPAKFLQVNAVFHSKLSFFLSVILGNAYLSLFFNMNQSPKVLKQCLSAYVQAVSLAKISRCNNQWSITYDSFWIDKRSWVKMKIFSKIALNWKFPVEKPGKHRYQHATEVIRMWCRVEIIFFVPTFFWKTVFFMLKSIKQNCNGYRWTSKHITFVDFLPLWCFPDSEYMFAHLLCRFNSYSSGSVLFFCPLWTRCSLILMSNSYVIGCSSHFVGTRCCCNL